MTFKSKYLNDDLNKEKINNIQNLINYQKAFIDDCNKQMENDDDVFDCSYIIKPRVAYMNSWSIVNLEVLDEIITLYEKCQLPVFDMGCGRGLHVVLLNYLDVPTLGFDNGVDSNVTSVPIFKSVVLEYITKFNIPWCGDDKFIFADIDDLTSPKKKKPESLMWNFINCKYIFFQSWGRSCQAVNNYVEYGGKYVIIIGECNDRSTEPSYEYLHEYQKWKTSFIEIFSFKFIYDGVSINIKN